MEKAGLEPVRGSFRGRGYSKGQPAKRGVHLDKVVKGQVRPRAGLQSLQSPPSRSGSNFPNTPQPPLPPPPRRVDLTFIRFPCCRRRRRHSLHPDFLRFLTAVVGSAPSTRLHALSGHFRLSTLAGVPMPRCAQNQSSGQKADLSMRMRVSLRCHSP